MSTFDNSKLVFRLTLSDIDKSRLGIGPHVLQGRAGLIIRMAALDLMIKSLMASREFNEQPNKNWEAICRLIPGTTVKQVLKLNHRVTKFTRL